MAPALSFMAAAAQSRVAKTWPPEYSRSVARSSLQTAILGLCLIWATGRAEAGPESSSTASVAPALVGASTSTLSVIEAPLGATATATATEQAPLLVGAATATATEQAPPPPAPDIARARPGAARGLTKPRGVEPEDVVLFLPRLVLTPVRWVLAAVFYPLRLGAGAMQEHAVIEHIRELLYTDDRKAGLMPSVNFLSSAGLSAGLRLFDNDVFGHDELLEATASFGGLVNYAVGVRFKAEQFLGTRLWIETELRGEAQPKLLFSGLGTPAAILERGPHDPRATSAETFYSENRVLARLRLGTTYGANNNIKPGLSLLFNHRRFDGGERLGAGDASIDSVYDTGRLPGFDSGTDLLELTADLILDYRDSPGLTSSGVYIEAFAGGVPPQDGFRFVHYGAEVAGFIDLFRGNRVLALRLALEGVEGDPGRVPFSNLPRLGGPHRLRGYRLDRFRDEKAVLGTIEYHYPIHQYLAGILFFDAGQVAQNYGDLFDPRDLKFGGGGGLVLGTADSITFKLDLSYGDAFRVFLSSDLLRAFSGRTRWL